MCDHNSTWPRLLFLPNTNYVFIQQWSSVHLRCSKRLTLPFCLSSGNETYYSSQGRVILKPHNDVPNALFVYEEATMEDRGQYSCIATNAYNFTSNATSYVRVKGKECSMLEAVCFIFHVVLNERLLVVCECYVKPVAACIYTRYRCQSNATVYYTKYSYGYMFRLHWVIIRLSKEQIQCIKIRSAFWNTKLLQ